MTLGRRFHGRATQALVILGIDVALISALADICLRRYIEKNMSRPWRIEFKDTVSAIPIFGSFPKPT